MYVALGFVFRKSLCQSFIFFTLSCLLLSNIIQIVWDYHENFFRSLFECFFFASLELSKLSNSVAAETDWFPSTGVLIRLLPWKASLAVQTFSCVNMFCVKFSQKKEKKKKIKRRKLKIFKKWIKRDLHAKFNSIPRFAPVKIRSIDAANLCKNIFISAKRIKRLWHPHGDKNTTRGIT